MSTATPAPPLAPAQEPRRKERIRRSQVPEVTRKAQARLGVLLVLPLLLMVVVFLLFPMVNAIYYVFVDFNGIDPTPPWVGLANFTELAQDLTSGRRSRTTSSGS
ncbi:MAG: hypothetical protein M3P31_01120 [Actinomycetota bacterium]|nr:hypothetical protein [Actinomycetota bacterium]